MVLTVGGGMSACAALMDCRPINTVAPISDNTTTTPSAIIKLLFIFPFAEPFYSPSFKEVLRGGVNLPEWQKDSGKAGVGQWRNGLRAWGIGRGRAGVNRARRRLYAGFGAPRNASFAKGGSREAFLNENDREGRFHGRKWLATGPGRPKTRKKLRNTRKTRKWGEISRKRGGICPRSEVRGRRSEKVHLREFPPEAGRSRLFAVDFRLPGGWRA